MPHSKTLTLKYKKAYRKYFSFSGDQGWNNKDTPRAKQNSSTVKYLYLCNNERWTESNQHNNMFIIIGDLYKTNFIAVSSRVVYKWQIRLIPNS